MGDEDRVLSLEAKHHELEDMLEAEHRRPFPDDSLIATLKKEKLRIKDALAQLAREVEEERPSA